MIEINKWNKLNAKIIYSISNATIYWNGYSIIINISLKYYNEDIDTVKMK